jgi:broad specificity phosphatase PhoE
MLWLIRHAEVEVRYQGIFGGRIDMDLSPLGHQQAAVLATHLRHVRFDALYASPMKRVQQTLAPALANGCPRPNILPELREVDFGDWTGLSWAEVEVRYGVSAFSWLHQLENDAVPNAEAAHVLRARLEPALRQIIARHPGQQIGIACHGGVIRSLLSILLDWPLPRFSAIEIDYASITQAVLSDGEACLQLVNFTPWRDLPK